MNDLPMQIIKHILLSPSFSVALVMEPIFVVENAQAIS